MPNKNGKAYGLTVLFPIRHGMSGNMNHKEALRSYLAEMSRDEHSPFARSPITHFSRMVVVDKLGYNGEPSLVDDLKSGYLLWTACFNGELAPWLNQLWQDMGVEWTKILNHCVAFDQYLGQEGFHHMLSAVR